MSDPPEHSPPRRGLPLRPLLSGLTLGLLVSCGVGFGTLVWIFRGDLQTLTPVDLTAARQRWEEHGPASYDLELLQSGSQQARVQVEVRAGEVTALSVNGRPPRRRATWDYWSVPNLLAIMEDELDQAGRQGGQFAGAEASQVMLRAQFDPHYGYPRRYQRFVYGTPQEIAWEIVRFEPRE